MAKRGRTVTFHGAFGSKAKAVAKERRIRGAFHSHDPRARPAALRGDDAAGPVTPELALVVALVTLLVGLANLGGLFYWAGRFSKTVEVLERDVSDLREWKHHHLNAETVTGLEIHRTLEEHEGRVGRLETDVEQLQETRP